MKNHAGITYVQMSDLRATITNMGGLMTIGAGIALQKAGVPGSGGILGFITKYLDPERRRALQAEIEEHLLSEGPRIVELIEARAQEIEAAMCTPVEAMMIAYQVFEAQRRTLDEEKRRNLSNVLVNGLCVKPWDKVKHRLMVRLTSELEEEHVARLRRDVRTLEEIRRDDMEAMRRRNEPGFHMSYEEIEERNSISTAIDRELVARGLLTETAKLKEKKPRTDPRALKDQSPDLEYTRRISTLGVAFLDHLRDPDKPAIGA